MNRQLLMQVKSLEAAAAQVKAIPSAICFVEVDATVEGGGRPTGRTVVFPTRTKKQVAQDIQSRMEEAQAMRQQTRQKVEALEQRACINVEPGEVLLDYRWSGPAPEDGRLTFRIPATEKSPARIIPREPGETDEAYQERAAQVCKAAQGRRIGKRDLPRLETFYPRQAQAPAMPEQEQPRQEPARPKPKAAPAPEEDYHAKRLRELGSTHRVSTF